MVARSKVARDSKGQIMWVKGRTDISILTYREWKEGEDMLYGTISKTTGLGLHIFYPPFTISEEEIV